MSMSRSALGRVSRRLSAAQSVTSRSVPVILQAPAPPSLLCAAPWTPRPGPWGQLTRTFTSAVSAARTRRAPNIQAGQHFPVICKGTNGLKSAEQKRFFYTPRERSAGEKFLEWVDSYLEPLDRKVYPTPPINICNHRWSDISHSNGEDNQRHGGEPSF